MALISSREKNDNLLHAGIFRFDLFCFLTAIISAKILLQYVYFFLANT